MPGRGRKVLGLTSNDKRKREALKKQNEEAEDRRRQKIAAQKQRIR